MHLEGLEIKNYRSIGHEPVNILPINKINVLIGENNSGKSNLIRIIKKIADWVYSGEFTVSELDFHNRDENIPIEFSLFFKIEEGDDLGKLIEICNADVFWFKFQKNKTSKLEIVDDYFRSIKTFEIANNALHFLIGRHWNSVVREENIRSEFSEHSNVVFGKFKSCIKKVVLIPEFRQIREGEKYSNDGTQLIEVLRSFQSPSIGKDKDIEKFISIQQFVRELLNLSNATLQISHPDSQLIIEYSGLRLPLENFGTGVHELLILITAFLMEENCIYCIEEPEIHFHPKLQKQIIRFLDEQATGQYFISTHSSVFINQMVNCINGKVFHIKNKGNNTVLNEITSTSEIRNTLIDLGLNPSDILVSNCIIWVEGPSDRILINKWIELTDGSLLEGIDYTFLFYRTYPPICIDDSFGSRAFINIFQINPNIIYIADSDKISEDQSINTEKETLKNKCDEIGGLGILTKGREIENYFTKSIINKFLLEVREISTEESFGKYQKFGEYLSGLSNKFGFSDLNYECQKVNYCKKIADLYQTEDISEDLKNDIDEIAKTIRKFKG